VYRKSRNNTIVAKPAKDKSHYAIPNISYAQYSHWFMTNFDF